MDLEVLSKLHFCNSFQGTTYAYFPQLFFSQPYRMAWEIMISTESAANFSTDGFGYLIGPVV